ncbi:MAG: DNA polymerase Y family protein, partial [Acidobacteria bacterium]|nr:DNA polymerase Y family protein [Acidobacteriota bacterium]
MSRLACVDVPALPLQILLRRHPEWRQEPVAVVTEDKVQARISWANRQAVTLGVRPGMRQAAAVACCPALRIDHVRASEVEREVRRLAERLHRWTPQVESASSLAPQLSGCGAAGTFWLRASGLTGLFGPLSDWIDALSKDLQSDGFRASVAVGFTRFNSFAAARATFGLQIFESPAEERSAALRAPLVRFGLPEKALAGLEKLGISSLRDLLRLAGEGRSGRGLANRFGKELLELHRLVSGERFAPVSETFRPETPVEHRISFEPPETDIERLIFHAKRLLDQVLADLGKQGLAVVELAYEVECEDTPSISGSVRPALPTEDGVKLLSLLRLRFGGISPEIRTTAGPLPRPSRSTEEEPGKRILGLVLRAHGGVYVAEQPGLYQRPGEALSTGPKRASEALAQIQAEFGEDSLVRLEIRDAHLPRGRYRCRPISVGEATLRNLPGKSPSQDFFETRTPRLIRRIYDQPLILPHRGSGEPDGWLLRGPGHGPVQSFTGPFRVSGGWWRLLSGRPVSRDYFFVRLKRGDVCWVFFDRERRSWFLEGRV